MKKLTFLLSLSSMIILCSCDSRTYEDISDNKPIELPVKYTADIKPIIENNCIGCHAEGSFIKPLATYEQVKNNINSILDRIQRPDGDPGKMPKGGSLSPAQINTFIKWKADGLTEN
ncbi:cytochrome c [Chryseobacterium lactis]|uniref:cytochrome c n=1 Tax=Chryseobacterium lactis TaxID=1241981 RepID=UPI0021AB7433|nr:cytochrome c [Chryseobacterium lactis]